MVYLIQISAITVKDYGKTSYNLL